MTGLLGVAAQSLRHRLWKGTVAAAAPSISNAEAEALIARFWSRDDAAGLIAAAFEAEKATASIDANKSIAKLLAKPAAFPAKKKHADSKKAAPPKAGGAAKHE